MSYPANKIRCCSLFRELDDAAIDRLVQHGTLRTYVQGHCVFDLGDPSDVIYILTEGRVCFDVFIENGKKITLGMAVPPRVIGEMELFDPGNRRSRATVLDDAMVFEIPKSTFLDVCRDNPGVYEKLLRIYAARLRDAGESLRIREDDKFLSRYLLHSVERFGSLSADKPSIDISQEFLSNLIGIPRQRINRILNQWKEKGWVELEYGSIFILNREALFNLSRNG